MRRTSHYGIALAAGFIAIASEQARAATPAPAYQEQTANAVRAGANRTLLRQELRDALKERLTLEVHSLPVRVTGSLLDLSRTIAADMVLQSTEATVRWEVQRMLGILLSDSLRLPEIPAAQPR